MKLKLLHYIESHPVCVVTSHGHGKIIGYCLTMGRIAKRALELMELDITCVPQTVIKSHALADFMVEWTDHNSCRSFLNQQIIGCPYHSFLVLRWSHK
jgi:hypothetical protein